jgi:hypothetical protein
MGESLEALAIAYGKDPKRVRKRLLETKALLLPEYKAFFRPGHYYADTKRLVGNNGYYLEWRVREFPDRPIDGENQQTSIGSVRLYRTKEEA